MDQHDPKVVNVEDGIAIPTGNGTATLTAKVGDQTATAEVDVSSSYDHPRPISFRNQVQSVLAKAGCNSGACHGAAAGKNGFKLSLRGYDAEARLFHDHAPGSRPAHHPQRSGPQFDAAEADRRVAA